MLLGNVYLEIAIASIYHITKTVKWRSLSRRSKETMDFNVIERNGFELLFLGMSVLTTNNRENLYSASGPPAPWLGPVYPHRRTVGQK